MPSDDGTYPEVRTKIAGDRPDGLIEGTATRDDVPAAATEWYL